MAEQKYKVTVTGEGDLDRVDCYLQEVVDMEMQSNGSESKWKGEKDVAFEADEISYEIYVKAPRTKFEFKIENTSNNKTLKEGEGYSRLPGTDGSEVEGTCDSE